MFQIVLYGDIGTYFMKPNHSFCLYSSDAARYESREVAEEALAAAAKNGKATMFARARVEAVQ
jgi:hypothetical protein